MKSREITDLKDEVEAKRMVRKKSQISFSYLYVKINFNFNSSKIEKIHLQAMDESKDYTQKWKKQSEQLQQELNSLRESMDGMNEEWRRKMKENENEIMEIQMSNHQSIGEMNGQLMEK